MGKYLREEEKRDKLSSIETIGKAALALTAGAALFYKTGGDDLLSKQYKGIKRAAEALTKDLSSLSRKDFDYDNIKKAVDKNILSNDSTYKKVINNNTIKIRPNKNNSAIGALFEYKQLKDNPSKILGKKYDSEMIIEPFKRQFVSKYKEKDIDKIDAIERFMNSVLSQKHNGLFIEKEGQKVFLKDEKLMKKYFQKTNIAIEEQNEMYDFLMQKMHDKIDNFSAYKEMNEDFMNNLYGAITPEKLAKKYGKKNSGVTFMENLLETSKATLKDIVDNRDNIDMTIKTKTKDGVIDEDFIDFIDSLIKKDERYGDIYADSFILKKDSKLQYFDALEETMDEMQDKISNTIPGKLFKTRDKYLQKRVENFSFIQKGDFEPTLSTVEKNDKKIINNDYVKIFDRVYKIANNNLEEIDEDFIFINRDYGFKSKMIDAISGNYNRKIKEHNGVFKELGLFTSPRATAIEELQTGVSKFKNGNWMPNFISKMIGSESPMQVIEDYGIEDFYNNLKILNKEFGKNLDSPNEKTISELVKSSSGQSRRFFQMLDKNDDDLLNDVLKLNTKNLYNNDLAIMISSYVDNQKGVMSSPNIFRTEEFLNTGSKSISFEEKLKKEILKEAMLTKVKNDRGPMEAVNFINGLDIADRDKKSLREYLHFAVFQDKTLLNSSNKNLSDIGSVLSTFDNAMELFGTKNNDTVFDKWSDYSRVFVNDVNNFINDKHSIFETPAYLLEDNYVEKMGRSKYISMRKGISALDIIKASNEEIIEKDLVNKYFKQYKAGRNDFENVTTRTMYPYYALYRLQEPLETLGLNLDPGDTKSVLDLSKNIMLKRVLPIAGAITAYSYLDYRLESYTGTGMTEAMLSGRANMEIHNARMRDKFGITNLLKSAEKYNPVISYAGIDTSSEEEKKEYYENGYDPVRKGRYWMFGSSSEFRGGKINYFEPNKLKQATSNYKDIAIYGSSEEKWAHSWIPTPRHPLSTLNALMNPYWLEEKHYWDRPYMVSAPLFEEGTPWAAILNPTVGRIIKPQRRMHRMETGDTLIDVRDIIARENSKIKEQASLISVDGSEFNVKNIYAKNVLMGNGSPGYSGYGGYGGYGENNPNLSYGIDGVNYGTGEFSTEGIPTISNQTSINSIKTSIGTSIITNKLFGSMLNTEDTVAMREILAINNNIRSNAANVGNTIKTNAKLEKVSAMNAKSIMQNKYDASDMRNIATNISAIDSAMYSLSELGGMYGFIGEQIFGANKKTVLENAGAIGSSSRAFWDNNVGGFGGEFMEIARRFIPHEDRSKRKINNLQNTMPDWMPDRFRHGDPYAAIPKGEARLPGPGYESLYNLHPDGFGTYGAFDRFKILADTAPWSEEYKIWKAQVRAMNKTDEMKKEYKNIIDRVEKQSRSHDFYDYKFLGKKYSSTLGTIAEIDGNNFTIVGSDEIFTIAGAKMSAGYDLQSFVNPGDEIRIKYGADVHNRKDNEGRVSAVIFKDLENVNKLMLDSGAAEVRDTDNTDAADIATLTAAQIDKGKFWEAISHAKIPYLHNKFLKVDTTLESYKKEQVYGTSYSTWDDPIDSFLKPALQDAWSRDFTGQALAIGGWVAGEFLNTSDSKTNRILGKTIFGALNPGAFTMGMVSFIPGFKTGNIMKGMRVGAALGTAGYALYNTENPISSTAIFSLLGTAVGEQFFHNKKAGAMIGAGAGLIASALQNPSFDKNLFGKKFIPSDIEKKWDIEEYYDRLEYMKYMGLYNKAARLAKREEGVDIKTIIDEYEEQQDKNIKIKEKLLLQRKDLENSMDAAKDKKLELIDSLIESMNMPPQYFNGGKFTKAAIAYKKAADSTIYGIDQHSSFSDVLRAIPKYNIDFFMEFAKERNPEKQKEILKYISPYQRKALNLLWGNDIEDQEDNSKYFSKHYMPNMFWGGWHNSTDLEYVKIKTIENEGLRLADFGLYESRKDEAGYKNAPSVNMNYDGANIVSLQTNISTVLTGLGLTEVNVDIQPSESEGLRVVADIFRTTNYKIQEKINSIFGRSYY